MKKSLCLGLFGLLTIGLLSACSTLPNCMDSQPYMHAEQYPPLKNPAGLDVPAPNPDMAIPNISNGPIGHYDNKKAADSDNDFADCLIAPPPMARAG